MFGDSFTKKEIVAFLILTALDWLSYLGDSLLARSLSSVARHVYICRLVFLTVFVLLIWVLYIPYGAKAFSGSRERYYATGGEARGMGTFYGLYTMWIWFILAIIKHPKIRRKNSA